MSAPHPALALRLAAALLVALITCPACSTSTVAPLLPPGSTEPIVKERKIAPVRGALVRVAFAGVEPAPDLRPFGVPSPLTAGEAATRTGEILRSAREAEGRVRVPAEALRQALPEVAAGAGAGAAPSERAVLAAEKTGATGLLVALLDRWRDRDGNAGSVKSPASVAFEGPLLSARGQRRWSATFAETQHSADTRPAHALRYPGRGTRWLTARDLAAWGAGHLAQALKASAEP